MIARILGTSRFLILIAVIGSFIAATTLIIYGGLAVIHISLEAFSAGTPTSEGAKELIVAFIEMIDLFLLCVVLYIISTGLYKLFVGNIDMPVWLNINTLDELKAQLINVVIALLAVSFLGQVVTHHGGIDILYLGIGIALVILALVTTLRFAHGDHDEAATHSDDPYHSLPSTASNPDKNQHN